MSDQYERFVVTNGQTVSLFSGTYTNPDYYSGYGAAGAVQYGGNLICRDVAFVGNTAKYGGAIYNIGSVTLDNVTFFDNIAKYGGAIYSIGDITFAGNVVLSTENDTIYGTGTTTWSISGESIGTLSNYSLLKSSGTFVITVATNQTTGSYLLAGNAATATEKSFTLTISGENSTTLTVGGDAIQCGSKKYQLSLIDNELILTISQATRERFVVVSGQTVSLAAGTYTNPFYYDGNGGTGEVQNGGTLVGENVFFVGNTASSGGAIYNNYGIVNLSGDVAFFDNTAEFDIIHGGGYGGAIYNEGGIVNLSGDVDFSGNRVEFDIRYGGGAGGAIYNGTYNGTGAFTLSGNATFTGNTAYSGGAIANSGTINIIGPCITLAGNTADNGGGAISNSGTVNFSDDATFAGNTAGNDGGAIYNYAGTVTLFENATFSGNMAGNAGGVIYNGNTINFFGASVSFIGNTASSGGAICNSGGIVNLSGDVTFTGNTAKLGGAIYNEGGIVNLSGDVAFFDNTAEFDIIHGGGYGGAIYNSGTINFSGTIDLATESDTWVNIGRFISRYATVNWDLSCGLDQYGTIKNFERYSNANTYVNQTITVNASQSTGDYIIATGDMSDLSGKNSFTLKTANDTTGITLTVDGSVVSYGERNYQLATADRSLILRVYNQGPITITADSASKVYDGTVLTAGYSYTPDVLVSGDKLLVSVEGSIIDTGTTTNTVTSYKVMRGDIDVTKNYTFTDCVDGTLSVNKRNVTLTSDSATKIYDGTALTAKNVTADGFVAGEGATYDVTGSQTEVGTSKNTFTYAFNDNTRATNYNVTIVEGDLTVTSAFPAVSDYNKSGKSDMVQFVNGLVYVTHDTASGYVQTSAINDITGWGVTEIRRDLTGDGYADIQITAYDGASQTWVATLRNDYLKTGCITLNYQFIGAYETATWSYLGSADFNGDGKSEILMIQTDAGKDPYGHRNVVGWVTDTTTCQWIDNIWLGALNDGWSITGTADLTGDGKDNLILRGADGMIGYWADFGGMPEDIVELKNAGNRILLTTGDLDGDGSADFLWQTMGSNEFSTWTSINGTMSDTVIGNANDLGGNWQFAGVGDYNGDGKDEILWCDTSTYKTAYGEANQAKFAELTVIV